MTTVTGASRRAVPALALGRAAAVLSLLSASLHLLLVDASSLGSLAMLGMALACLPCAWHLWRAPTAGVWAMTAALDTGMLLVHTQMLGSPPSMPGMARAATPLVVVGLTVVGTQLVLAGAVGLLALRRAPEN